jgi:hypothetical protein
LQEAGGDARKGKGHFSLFSEDSFGHMLSSMALNQIQQAARDQFQRQSANYGKSHILANTDDVVSALTGIEAAPGSTALDVATGGGHTAVCLAARGLSTAVSTKPKSFPIRTDHSTS